VLQCVAVCCSVQQCVAVCCSERYGFLEETRCKYFLSTQFQVSIIMHKSVSPDGVPVCCSLL